ncbi:MULTISPECIES: aminoglycoside phosphotransferase [unclassified Knoellia]|uniref:aminoglycoside phosphotransferase n=1 Tax=Knoellia altitudinis TaxID=3404795 RepID=UPI00360AF44D
MKPSARVLDLYAVPEDSVPLVGGQGQSVLAGDLVLSPGRSQHIASWLNPIIAPLSVELDHERPRSIRIAMPIPTRDLQWVADGWGATRFEPGTRPCTDLDVLLATGRLLHARLAAKVTTAPHGIRHRDDRWATAERVAFGESQPTGIPTAVGALVSRLMAELDTTSLGPEQLVHGDLAGNVLLDASGIPFVIDVSPYWRPALWAEAVCVLDALMWMGADAAVLRGWSAGARRQAMLRAAMFRVLSDVDPDVSRYERVVSDVP